VQIVEIVGSAAQNFPAGEMEVQLGARITNPLGHTITLKRIRLEPVAGGGPYEITPFNYEFNREIGPGVTEDIAFWARATAEGDQHAMDASAPVSLRATLIFDSPRGDLRKVQVVRLAH
jgi:hypothetical protein